jgi:hypothetical protein
MENIEGGQALDKWEWERGDILHQIVTFPDKSSWLPGKGVFLIKNDTINIP